MRLDFSPIEDFPDSPHSGADIFTQPTDAELRAHSPNEVDFDAMIAELLDRAWSHGHLSSLHPRFKELLKNASSKPLTESEEH